MYLYFPLILEIGFICLAIWYTFPIIFLIIQVSSISFYFIIVILVAEWRVKLFRDEAKKENAYNQKSTDALINYETVKYFNAEDHEQDRYMSALQEYKHANIRISISLGLINNIHSSIISI